MASIFQGDPFEREVSFAPADASLTLADRLARAAKAAPEMALDGAKTVANWPEGESLMGQHARLQDAVSPERSLVGAAYEQSRLVNSMSGRMQSLMDAADKRIGIIRDETGMMLENPFAQGYHLEARKRLQDRRDRGEIGAFGLPDVLAEQRSIFNEQVNLAAERFPDKAQKFWFYQPMEEQGRALAKSADAAAEQASAAVKNPLMNMGAELLGGMGAMIHDPVQVVGMTAGAGPSVARSMAVRIGQTAMKEALINAGLQALEEPAVQQWRAELQLKNGVAPALENIGMAALIGGAFGGGAAAIREALSPFRGIKLEDQQAMLRVLDGTASPDDVLRAADAAGLPLSPELRETIELAKRAEDAHRELAGAPPRGVDGEAHNDAMGQALHAADNPDAPPAAAPLPERGAAGTPQPHIGDDAPYRGNFSLLGKPVSETMVDPLALKTDAVTFQYKQDADGAGVTQRLQGVNAISPLATGKLIVFEAADGTRYVADGHQRTGLFRRLADESGQVPVATDIGMVERARVDVPAYVMREADGWTPAEVRAAAALKNIQEGSGTLLDTARILRDHPALDNGTLPLRGEHMQSARGLAALSQDAWGAVVNGRVEPNIAAWVGRIVPDRPEIHAALIADLARMDNPSVGAAQFAIRDALNAGFAREVQTTMFGELEQTVSLLKERGDVFSGALARLRKDKGLFARLNEQQAQIEATGGNKLDAAANAQRAEISALLADKLQILATRPGPISDLLNMRAQAVKEGQPLARASADFAADVAGIVQEQGLAGLEKRPEFKPRAEIEPGSKPAADQGEALLPGFEPVTDKARADVQAAKPLTGGDAPLPSGGLFDDLARGQTDLLDAIRAGEERSNRLDFAADLAESCRG